MLWLVCEASCRGEDGCRMDELLNLVTMRDIRGALFSMDAYKAPGPDGFQPIFFKSYWHLQSHDLYDFIAEAFNQGKIAHHIAHTMIVPIPKIDVPRYERLRAYQFL